MSKGIAVDTILYLLVGVMAVGIIVYLVYSYTTGPGLTMQDCRSRVQNWCTSCKIANWASGVQQNPKTSIIGTCVSTYFASSSQTLDWPIDCNKTYTTSPIDTKTFCGQFLK